MIGRTHLVIGVMSYAIYVKALNLEHNGILFSLMLIASILPDIDEKDSIIGRHFRPISYLVKHRGFFHSATPIILTVLLIWTIGNPTLAIGTAFSYFGHLLADSISKHGVHWLYPFGGRIKGPLKVGSKLELLILLPIFAIISVILLIT